MCVVISELYKEYRSLKQAKENSRSVAAGGHAEQSKSTPEANTAHKVPKTSVFVNVRWDK